VRFVTIVILLKNTRPKIRHAASRRLRYINAVHVRSDDDNDDAEVDDDHNHEPPLFSPAAFNHNDTGINAANGALNVAPNLIELLRPYLSTIQAYTWYCVTANSSPVDDNSFPIPFSVNPSPPVLDIQNSGKASSIAIATKENAQYNMR
jgi:hypothetical protein